MTHIHDPLGWLSLVLIKVKLVLQKLVGAKLGRDKLPKVELNGAAESALVKMLRSGSMTFLKSELGGSHIKQGLMLMGSSFPTTKKKVAKIFHTKRN